MSDSGGSDNSISGKGAGTIINTGAWCILYIVFSAHVNPCKSEHRQTRIVCEAHGTCVTSLAIILVDLKVFSF